MIFFQRLPNFSLVNINKIYYISLYGRLLNILYGIIWPIWLTLYNILYSEIHLIFHMDHMIWLFELGNALHDEMK